VTNEQVAALHREIELLRWKLDDMTKQRDSLIRELLETIKTGAHDAQQEAALNRLNRPFQNYGGE